MSVLGAWRLTGSKFWIGAVAIVSVVGLVLATWLGIWGIVLWWRVLFGPGNWALDLFGGAGAFLSAGILGVTFALLDLLTYFRVKLARLAREQLGNARIRIVVGG